ncbi:MAG: flagellar type III secretion system pore protein FliP [Pseudomonadota bacterium]
MRGYLIGIALLAIGLFAGPAVAQAPGAGEAADAVETVASGETSQIVRVALILTLMAFIPAMLVAMTSFVRIIIVLAMIRHGLGMPETPPNMVLVSLAIFLTGFAMMPTFEAMNDDALQPFLAGELTTEAAVDAGSEPLRDFMLRQVSDEDIETVYAIAGEPLPERAEDVDLLRLAPAFMLNELRVAFKIGFIILLPFLLIDLVVASILLSLGMLMVPPTTLSLPIKVLMFVLIDGWSLVLEGVLGSFR